MKVLKFGGTSVGTAENLLNVKRIVEANTDSVIVVVSALGGLTDKLIETARLAETGNVDFDNQMTAIKDRHQSIITQVISEGEKRDGLVVRVNELLAELHQHYQDVFAIRELSDKKLSAIVSYGERISSLIVAHLIEGAQWYDSLSFIKTEYRCHKHKLSGEATDRLIHAHFQSFCNCPKQEAASLEDEHQSAEAFYSSPKVALVPGFISSDVHTGEVTNLGRGGSDYTAAILAAALDAECLEIWTDVDGFMTADPRLIPSAYPIKELSYNEAEELCNYGAKVVYPPTIYPVWYKNIPVLIKNTMNPEALGTYIRHIESNKAFEGTVGYSHERMVPSVKGISSVKDTSLITISGVGEGTQKDLWRDLSQSLSDECIQVLVALQHPTTPKVLVGVKKEDTEYACAALQKRLLSHGIQTLMCDGRRALETYEIHSAGYNKVCQLDVTTDLSTIAMVGNVAHHPSGILDRLTSNLDKKSISVHTPCLEHAGLTFAYMVATSDLHTALEITHATAFQR